MSYLAQLAYLLPSNMYECEYNLLILTSMDKSSTLLVYISTKLRRDAYANKGIFVIHPKSMRYHNN